MTTPTHGPHRHTWTPLGDGHTHQWCPGCGHIRPLSKNGHHQAAEQTTTT